MTAPLFDVKAKFSEYITYAENGEVVEITKHGHATSVILSKEKYDELVNNQQRPNIIDGLKKWRAEHPDFTEEDWEEWEKGIQRDKTIDPLFFGGKSVWDE